MERAMWKENQTHKEIRGDLGESKGHKVNEEK